MNLVTTGAMNTKRTLHSATRLGGSGLVLIAGGLDQNGNPLASCEIFNPADGSFTTLTNALAVARYGHAAIVTAGGAVLIIGGQGAGAAFLASVEVFTPGSRPAVTGTFATAATGLSSARANMAAELLAGGAILISGGADIGAAALNLSEIYSPGI